MASQQAGASEESDKSSQKQGRREGVITSQQTATPEAQQKAASDDMQKRFEDAYSNYAQALQEAWTSQEVQRRSEDAYRDYLNYVRALQAAWAPDDIQKRLEEAYRDYARALQAAWTQVDVNAIDMGSMAAISQSIMAGVSATAAATNAVRERRIAAAWIAAYAHGLGGAP